MLTPLISVQQSIRFTYKQLQERVNLCASGFLRLGIERGDRIGIWSTNNASGLLLNWLPRKLARFWSTSIRAIEPLSWSTF